MQTSRGRVAGIDYGTLRIGVAISDPERKFASPLENYTRRNEALDRDFFCRLVKEERIVLFVVGLPVHLDGRESAKSREARAFADWLIQITGVAVEFFDERFTTHEAQILLSGMQLSKKKRKARLDKLAAQIMLTGYLERVSGDTSGEEQSLQGLDD